MYVLDVSSPSHRIFFSVASHLFVAIHHGDELGTHTTHAASQHNYTLHNIQHDSVKLMELGIACIIIQMKLSFSIDIVRSHFHAICAGANKNDRDHVSLYIEMPFEQEGFFYDCDSDFFTFEYDNFTIHPARHSDYCSLMYRIVYTIHPVHIHPNC